VISRISAERARWAVPFVDLERQEAAIAEELMAAVMETVRRRDFILGEALERFEAEFASYLGVRHVVGVGSGGMALTLALRALGVGSGDEVITQANSYIATAFAVTHLGARPVLVDVDPTTFQMDAEKLESAITARSRAVVLVHLYGYAGRVDEIAAIAARHNLPVIEDAAQAHGTTYRGQTCGTFGIAASFSFYPSKNLGCWGDGGAVVTNAESVADRIKLWRSYGDWPKNYHTEFGVNSRLDTIQAAVLRVKLRMLDRWNDQRRQVAAWYRKWFQELDVDRYVQLPPFELSDQRPNWHLFVIRVSNGQRDVLRAYLATQGIECGIHYPRPIHLQPVMTELGYKPGDFPVAEALAGEVLSLPMFAGLQESECKHVVERIRSFFTHGPRGTI
jgi:dTDP-4-amino-4,6-dideoxygalactose transaminase